MCGDTIKDVLELPGKVVKGATKALGLTPELPRMPDVVRSDPLADQAKLEADAAALAGRQATASKRRRRFSSLLATGTAAGDTARPVTANPSASSTKTLLGE